MPDGQSSKRSWPEWLPVVALIALAILIRVPRLGDIASSYDWLTSHTVLITRVWQMTGLAANHYSLVTNWPNDADRQAEYGPGSVFDAQGNTYFLSFPPLAFYLSYTLFSLFGQGATLLPLRLLMWVASSLGALALARAVRSAWGEASAGITALTAASVAAAVFLLSPVSLYYYGTAYFSLILSVPLWMALIAVCFSGASSGARRPWIVGTLTFLLCYTDWLGFLALVPLTIVWVRRREWRLAFWAGATAVLALAVTLWTYASIAGWPALVDSFHTKYLIRSGIAMLPNTYSAFRPGAYLAIWRNYLLGFAPLALPFAVAGAGFLAGRGRMRPPVPPAAWTLLFCLALPVALDHVLLINHTAYHRYAMLKTAPALGVALSICLTARPWRNRNLDLAAGALALAGSAVVFYRSQIQTPPEIQAVANLVEYQVGLDRVLFFERNRLLSTAEPALLLLTERNFHVVDNVEQAREKMRRLGIGKGLYVQLTPRRPPAAVLITPSPDTGAVR